MQVSLPRPSLRGLLLAAALVGLTAGFWAQVAGAEALAPVLWAAGTVPVLGALLVQIVVGLRRGDFGLDIVAALSMSAALAVGETLAAAVVALMYAGGQFLERFAERRAGREMTALLSRVPRTTLRHGPDGLSEVPLDAVEPGDRLMIRRGDVAPVDGVVSSGTATLDESSLTGESLPMTRAEGHAVLSGAVNLGDAFDLTAERRAADSTFAGIVRMVEAARSARAPMARLADRYALGFLGVTLALAGTAWGATADPVRAVAVLVIATPCPLILAVPVALVAGLSRAAGRGILVKDGRALESLAQIAVLVVDKTGTLTHGEARVTEIRAEPGWNEDALLRLAAGLDQASPHAVARALVAEAQARGLRLPTPSDISETAGEGVAGRVEGHGVRVGARAFVAAGAGPQEGAPAVERRDAGGALSVHVSVDGVPAGEIMLADPARRGVGRLFQRLRGHGVTRIVLATGDRQEVADAVALGLGLDAIRGGLTPEQKVDLVVAERSAGRVLMIGDGVNDAPALAAADVGMAMGARGAAASAETADVVLLVDRLDRVLPAIRIARRARAIAVQSVVVGIGLSVAGMIAAAFGQITPVQGALLQEAIDVAVILNALRALRAG